MVLWREVEFDCYRTVNGGAFQQRRLNFHDDYFTSPIRAQVEAALADWRAIPSKAQIVGSGQRRVC